MCGQVTMAVQPGRSLPVCLMVYAGVLACVLCPLYCLYVLVSGADVWLPTAIFFIYWFIARWDATSFYLRYLFVAALFLIVYLRWGVKDTSICVLAFAATLFVFALTLGRAPRKIPRIEVSFPLVAGTCYVAHGGNSLLLNRHSSVRSQRYALDIVKLNRCGARAAGLYPADCQRYSIYGEEVCSPCNGEVTKVVNDIPDLPPSRVDRTRLAGNHVIIRMQDEMYICLAHLMCGSVTARVGHQVTTGQILGRVGNSGHTTEPHLHIHAKKGGNPNSGLDGEGVPICFAGKWLVRNSLFRSPRRLTIA